MTLRRWRTAHPVHWSWLHGPTDRPDPRVGEMSLSAARRGRGVSPVWALLADRTDTRLEQIREEPIMSERTGS
jgi:hypothetical protein